MIFPTHSIKASQLKNLSTSLIILIAVVLSVSVSDSREVSLPPKEELTKEFIPPNPCDFSPIEISLKGYYDAQNQELDDRLNKASKYQNYIDALSACTQPPAEYNSQRIEALRLYFEAFLLRTEAESKAGIDSQTRRQQLLEALELIDEAIAITDTSAAFYNERGIVYELLEFPGEAAVNYDQAISRKTDWALPHNNMANVLLTLDEKDEAIDAYDKAMARRGDLDLVKSNYAQLLAEIEPSRAESMANEISSGNFDLQKKLALAKSQIERGNDAAATAIYDSLNLGPTSSKQHGRHGLLHLKIKKKEYDEAVSGFREIFADTPNQIDVGYLRQLEMLYRNVTGSGKQDIKNLLKDIQNSGNLPPEGYALLNIYNILNLSRLEDEVRSHVSTLPTPAEKVDFIRRVSVKLYSAGYNRRAWSIADIARELQPNSVLAQRLRISYNIKKFLFGDIHGSVTDAYSELDSMNSVTLSREYLCAIKFYDPTIRHIFPKFSCDSVKVEE